MHGALPNTLGRQFPSCITPCNVIQAHHHGNRGWKKGQQMVFSLKNSRQQKNQAIDFVMGVYSSYYIKFLSDQKIQKNKPNQNKTKTPHKSMSGRVSDAEMLSSWCTQSCAWSHWPDLLEETFPKSDWFISHGYLGKSPEKILEKRRSFKK